MAGERCKYYQYPQTCWGGGYHEPVPFWSEFIGAKAVLMNDTEPFFLTLANGFRGAVDTISGFLDGASVTYPCLKAARIRSLSPTLDNFQVAFPSS